MSPLPPLGFFAGVAAPLGDYQAIMTATVDSGGSASIDFTSIPQTYKHLQIRGIVKSTSGATGVGWGTFKFNSDTGSNYTAHVLYGTGASAGAFGSANYSGVSYSLAGGAVGTNMFCANIIDILDYADTNKYKTVRVLGGGDFNNSNGEMDLLSSVWRNTAAINAISFSGNTLAEFSQFALYGLKG